MLRDLAYGLYSRKLRRELSGAVLPRHVGLIMDGNRRWARQMGLASPSLGHKYGAEHVEDVLNWCERGRDQARDRVRVFGGEPATAR
jgi:short-chain Z-isoprenyl diphosphate synthase